LRLDKRQNRQWGVGYNTLLNMNDCDRTFMVVVIVIKQDFKLFITQKSIKLKFFLFQLLS